MYVYECGIVCVSGGWLCVLAWGVVMLGGKGFLCG